MNKSNYKRSAQVLSTLALEVRALTIQSAAKFSDE